MIFELVYKTVIVMIDINDALRELNALSSKESKNSIGKLIDLVGTDQKTSKSFSSETAFASPVLPAASTQITFEKIIEFLIEAFKIMHFNSARTVIVDEVQRIVNVTLYRQSVTLPVNALVGSGQISVQVVQVNIFNSEDCYGCAKSGHRINDCPKVNQLVNSELIHFNERRRMCFDRAEQGGAEMRLQYELFRAEAVRQCLQQVNDSQSVAVKVNSVIIVKKLSFSKDEHNEEELHDEKMLMKIRAARHENDFSARKVS